MLRLFPSKTIRSLFTDAVRTNRLIQKLQIDDPTKALVPIQWNLDYVTQTEFQLRQRLRSVDFVVEVRDARIPVSSWHPSLRRWSGKKPRVIVLNKSDLITHQERMQWERHLEQKNMHVIWTAANMTKGGISNLIRRFFDANFEVNRRRRKTLLPLRKDRTVLTALVGYPDVGKRTLFERLIGPNPKLVEGPIPDKGRPDLVDHSLNWYKVEGGVFLMDATPDIPPPVDDPAACLRLAMCGHYRKDKTFISTRLVAAALIDHLASLKNGPNVVDAMYNDFGIQPKDSTSPINFIERIAGDKFEGDVDAAGSYLLEKYKDGEYGPVALEMPYMLSDSFKLEDPIIYDKDAAFGLATGICSRY